MPDGYLIALHPVGVRIEYVLLFGAGGGAAGLQHGGATLCLLLVVAYALALLAVPLWHAVRTVT